MENYKKIEKRVGRRLFKLAVRWSREGRPQTKKQRLEDVQAVKGRKKFRTKKEEAEVAEYLHELAGQMAGVRYNRPKPYNPPTTSAVERMLERRLQLILRASATQREEYSGVTQSVIKYGEPKAYTVTSAGEQYSKGCTYRKNNAQHVIVVPPNWWAQVYKRGLDRVDGMMTLAAKPVDAGGITAYQAVWLRSKGKRLSTESGYIVLDPEHGSAHTRTLAAAKGLITRRIHDKEFERHARKIRQKLEELKLEGLADIQVTIGDSLAAGNCKSGTMEFRDRHFPGRDKASVEEVLSVGDMRRLAINACLRAIRRTGACAA